MVPEDMAAAAKSPLRIGLIGDHDPGVTAHRAIPSALALAAGGISLCWPLTMARLAAIGSAVSSDGSQGGVSTAALVGAFTSAGYLGWLLGPAVIGTLSDHEGLRAGLLLLAGVAAAACATLAAVNPRPLAR